MWRAGSMRFLVSNCPILCLPSKELVILVSIRCPYSYLILNLGLLKTARCFASKKHARLVFHANRAKNEKKVSSCVLTRFGQFGRGVDFDTKSPAVHSRKNVSSAPVVLISTKQSATVRRLDRLPEMLSDFFAFSRNRNVAKREESVANFLNGLLSLGFRSSKMPILGKMRKTTRQLVTKYRLRLA